MKPCPPKPEELFSRDAANDNILIGVRTNSEVYSDFLAEYMQTAFGKRFCSMWEDNEISQFIPTALEAFLLAAYDNGYTTWMHKAEGGDPNASPSYKYTSESQGAVQVKGWREEGMQLYEDLFVLIDEQREEQVTGKDFERQFMLRDNPNSKKRKAKVTRKIRPNSWAKTARREAA